jgi:hypothetical protein
MLKKYGTSARRAANKLTFQVDMLMVRVLSLSSRARSFALTPLPLHQFAESCGITTYLLVLAFMIVSAIGRKTGTQADITAVSV